MATLKSDNDDQNLVNEEEERESPLNAQDTQLLKNFKQLPHNEKFWKLETYKSLGDAIIPFLEEATKSEPGQALDWVDRYNFISDVEQKRIFLQALALAFKNQKYFPSILRAIPKILEFKKDDPSIKAKIIDVAQKLNRNELKVIPYCFNKLLQCRDPKANPPISIDTILALVENAGNEFPTSIIEGVENFNDFFTTQENQEEKNKIFNIIHTAAKSYPFNIIQNTEKFQYLGDENVKNIILSAVKVVPNTAFEFRDNYKSLPPVFKVKIIKEAVKSALELSSYWIILKNFMYIQNEIKDDKDDKDSYLQKTAEEAILKESKNPLGSILQYADVLNISNLSSEKKELIIKENSLKCPELTLKHIEEYKFLNNKNKEIIIVACNLIAKTENEQQEYFKTNQENLKNDFSARMMLRYGTQNLFSNKDVIKIINEHANPNQKLIHCSKDAIALMTKQEGITEEKRAEILKQNGPEFSLAINKFYDEAHERHYDEKKTRKHIAENLEKVPNIELIFALQSHVVNYSITFNLIIEEIKKE